MGHMPERILNLSRSCRCLRFKKQLIFHCFLQHLKKKYKFNQSSFVVEISSALFLKFFICNAARPQSKCSLSLPCTNKEYLVVMEILNLVFSLLCSTSTPPSVLQIPVFCWNSFFPRSLLFFLSPILTLLYLSS